LTYKILHAVGGGVVEVKLKRQTKGVNATMNHINQMLELCNRESWTRVGFGWEKSTLWKAIYWGFEVLKEREVEAQALKDNVNGTGTDVTENTDADGAYETEEDVSPYVAISKTEKFQWACYILNWMDDNEEFHYYEKSGNVLWRHRPDVAEEVEKFLLKPFSKAEKKLMVDAFGEKHAENWAKQAEKERTANFERYGSELVDLIRDSRSGGWTDLDHTDSETDWNWSAFGEDVGKTLSAKVAFAQEKLNKDHGYTQPWVISIGGNLAMLEKACITN